jgi:hypothetical protein
VPRRCRPEPREQPRKAFGANYQCAVAAVNARARSGGGMTDGKRHAVRAGSVLASPATTDNPVALNTICRRIKTICRTLRFGALQ